LASFFQPAELQPSEQLHFHSINPNNNNNNNNNKEELP